MPLAMTIEQFAERYLKASAHQIVREDAAALGLTAKQTDDLVAEFDRDPIGYAAATRGDWQG